VRANTVVVAGVGPKHAAKMCLTEYDDVVEAFPTDRADEAFDVTILPW
jgi:hypothetical protein